MLHINWFEIVPYRYEYNNSNLDADYFGQHLLDRYRFEADAFDGRSAAVLISQAQGEPGPRNRDH